MKKTDLAILFILSLLILSINFVYQQHPGYMDSEYYYLGGLQLSKGDYKLPVIWNYLDEANQLPHPLFSYWLPFASILSGLSVSIFGATFFGSRIIFWVLAAGLSPLSYYVGFSVTKNRFIGIISGLLAIFCGYYFKFITIPETFIPSMYLGTIFFLVISRMFNKRIVTIKEYSLLGVICGLLQLSRSDGVIFFLMGLTGILYISIKNKKPTFNSITLPIVIFFGTYILINAPFYFYNYQNFRSFISPATSKAMWIAIYDDTFLYPSSQLSYSYFLRNGLPLRFDQIIQAIKLNFGSFIGVQLLIIGVPLVLLGYYINKNNLIFRIAVVHLTLVFLLMSLIFPLAGGRGGFFHASAANQIIIWIIIAAGLEEFIVWGINNRNWKQIRSRKMFGAAIILFASLLTFIIYQRDVIGDQRNNYRWNKDYSTYAHIESIISNYSHSSNDVVMINNPIGYFYKTGRWSVAIPNSSPGDLISLTDKLNIKFLVLDENIPDRFSQDHLMNIENEFNQIYQNNHNLRIYEKRP